MDRHTAADLEEALDPDLGLPVHSDTFDAIETDAGTFAAELRSRRLRRPPRLVRRES